MRYSDKPIDRPRLDLLGRARFALFLAQSIDNLAIARDGFVIAIQGAWGSGKTSLIEMICRYLRHIEMVRISNSTLDGESAAMPTTLAELDAMEESFERVEAVAASFDGDARYTRAVRAARDGRWNAIRRLLDSDEHADAADRYWRLRARADERSSIIIVRFSPWLISSRAELASALISDLARAVGQRLGEGVKRAFGGLLRRISEFAPVAGVGLDLASHGIGAGALARVGSSWSAKVAERMISGPTLDEIREELRGLLASLHEKKILVIVDDLDRLTAADALEMVSAVKSLGDLPNVVYLLCYDETKLNELITIATKTDGHEFLEKIIQYPVRLPAIEVGDLER